MALSTTRGNGEYLTRATGLSNLAFTASFWVHFTDITGGADAVFGRYGTGSSASQIWTSSGGVLSYDDGSTYSQGSTLSNNTWYHLAVTRTAAGVSEIFLDGASDFTHSGNTAVKPGVNLMRTPTNHQFDDYECSGRLAAFKAWDVVIADADILQELYFFTPIRTADLANFSPFVADETVNFRDYSGTAPGNWTETGTVETGSGPPITWRKGASRIFLPAAAAADISHVAALAESFDNVVQRRPIKVTNF